MTGAVYLLDKQIGITSRKAASRVAHAQGFKKYGHCGTLDPDATGLLVVLLGKATRLASYISGSTKRYSFQLVTGISTDTLDMSGKVLEQWDTSSVTTAMVQGVLENYTGTFMQKVPAFSAVRVNGKRGYELARQGKTIEMPEREVTVSQWKCGRMSEGRITLEVTVSQGTYIRALCRDIGISLGIPAVADNIRRTRAGVFSVDQAAQIPDSKGALLTMAQALKEYPQIVLSQHDSVRISHGMSVDISATGITVLLNRNGEVAAIAQGFEKEARPLVVFPGGEGE